jgi:hypothetical protein
MSMTARARPAPASDPKKPRIIRLLGPGLITGASDDDPSGIATYSQAGAQFGFAISWTMLFSYPLMVAIQQISGRIGRSASLPTITPEAIARSPLPTSPSVLIAAAPCGGSQPCHGPATLHHFPVTRHDVPPDAHRDRARSQSCRQRCLHRHPAADQSLQPGMPAVPAAEIDATTAHGPRSPIPRANKPLSARPLQPRRNVKRQQASATIPIVPHLPRLRSIRLL